MSPTDLRMRVQELGPDGPFTIQLTTALAARSSTRGKAWYGDQREHWMGWLREYDGPGAYGRQVHSGRAASFIYNHIMSPPMILWLGEAAGAEKQVLKRAVADCLAAGPTLPKQCGAVRSAVPWASILKLLSRDTAAPSRQEA